VDAFIGERHGAGAAQPLARCTDDGAAAFDPKIHCFTPLTSDAASVANLARPDKPCGFAQAEIVGTNARRSPAGKRTMSDLFDVSQETILITGAS
jgi:hypothetical protein